MQIPDDSLARSLAIFDVLHDDAAWTEDRTALRFTSTSLATASGDPATLAKRTREVADTLAAESGWFGPLRSAVRYCVAAMLVTHDLDPLRFLSEVDRTSARLRERRMRRGDIHEILATLILMGRSHRVADERVARFCEIYDAMRRHHPWITGADDYPSCALLVEAPPARLVERIEHFYESLRALGFRRGNALQLVSHLLVLNPAPDDVAVRRFADIYQAFRDDKLWMDAGDYDEVAMLTFLDQPAAQITRRVAEHRDVIQKHRPRPGKQLGFSLACTTVFLDALRGDERVSVVAGVGGMIQAQALIAAQNAAVVAAIAAGGAAAASSSS